MPPAHTFALFWSQCLSDSVRGVSWHFTLTNLFLVIVRFAICSPYHAEWPTEPMLSHKIPSRPWSKISVDLFAMDGKQYLVMVDHYSDYFELEPLRNAAASTVIRAMKRNFARHGIPDTCISDNGPQFDCHEFSRFTRDYGFAMVKSSPYHSRGNGKAESAVKIAKNILKKSREEDPYIDLLAYRNTCLLYTSPSPRDLSTSRMPSSA